MWIVGLGVLVLIFILFLVLNTKRDEPDDTSRVSSLDDFVPGMGNMEPYVKESYPMESIVGTLPGSMLRQQSTDFTDIYLFLCLGIESLSKKELFEKLSELKGFRIITDEEINLFKIELSSDSESGYLMIKKNLGTKLEGEFGGYVRREDANF